MTSIKFGTDGWRALIGQDFIPSNIEQVIQAFCDWRTAHSPKQKKIILGFDRRSQSDTSAKLAAEVLAGNNFNVLLSKDYCPTPCISWMVKNSEAFAGIMITASHNPWTWNGIKFKEEYGGSASQEYTEKIETQLQANQKTSRKILKMPFQEAQKKGFVQFFDPKKDYLNQIANLIDLPAIQKAGFKILYDAMFGAGSHYMETLLGPQVTEMRNSAPPADATNPEPIDKYLGEFIATMKKGSYHLGLATDGDADRIGALDEDGNFVSSHLIFALLLKHYVEDKKLTGTVVKSLSTTNMINLLCQKYDIPCLETPVGFKYICKELVAHDALMGGEESGGISFKPHVHERDGILNGLMILNMMSVRKKTLKELVADLFAEFGNFFYNRLDLHVKPENITRMKENLSKNPPQDIAGFRIVKINSMDGFKYIFEDGSWLLFRTSGTEPLVRVYAEGRTMEKVKALLEAGKNIVTT